MEPEYLKLEKLIEIFKHDRPEIGTDFFIEAGECLSKCRVGYLKDFEELVKAFAKFSNLAQFLDDFGEKKASVHRQQASAHFKVSKN